MVLGYVALWEKVDAQGISIFRGTAASPTEIVNKVFYAEPKS